MARDKCSRAYVALNDDPNDLPGAARIWRSASSLRPDVAAVGVLVEDDPAAADLYHSPGIVSAAGDTSASRLMRRTLVVLILGTRTICRRAEPQASRRGVAWIYSARYSDYRAVLIALSPIVLEMWLLVPAHALAGVLVREETQTATWVAALGSIRNAVHSVSRSAFSSRRPLGGALQTTRDAAGHHALDLRIIVDSVRGGVIGAYGRIIGDL